MKLRVSFVRVGSYGERGWKTEHARRARSKKAFSRSAHLLRARQVLELQRFQLGMHRSELMSPSETS